MATAASLQMQTQSFGMPVVRASWRGPLLAALGLLAACNPARAVQDVASALYFYDGDGKTTLSSLR